MDDEAFNLIAHKVILKEAEQSIIKELCNKQFGSSANYVMPNVDIVDLVDVRKNGEEALKAIKDAYYSRKYQYALILTDISMPVMDGF